MSIQDELKKLSEKIKQYRDEARVQLHLAREDIKDEWDDLEQDWERFRSKLDKILHNTEDAQPGSPPDGAAAGRRPEKRLPEDS